MNTRPVPGKLWNLAFVFPHIESWLDNFMFLVLLYDKKGKHFMGIYFRDILLVKNSNNCGQSVLEKNIYSIL